MAAINKRSRVPGMRDVHKQARKGIRLLLVRQGFLQVFTFLGGIVLARVLNPADFGLFGITTFLVNILALFADFGMSPALIQRKKEISDRDLQIGFTMKQVLVSVVVVMLWFGAPWLASFYPKDTTALIWLVRAMGFSLYLNTWRSISAIQLERTLRYEKLAVVEVVESLSYQIVAVGMAVFGFGVWSLISAVLMRGLLGTILVYIVAPWKVRLDFDREVALDMLRFGLPFQLHRVVGNVRTWVTPTLVASLIGADAVGFLMWASSNGRKPLTVVQNVVRVSLPHFSRIQDNLPEVKRILSQYVMYFLVFCGAWFAVIAAAGYPVVELVYTAKWLPAVPALILYAGLLNLNAVSWIVKTALSGTGRVKYVMYVTMLTTAISVGLSVALVLTVGFIGVPIAEVVSMVVTVPILARGLGRSSIRRIFLPSAWVLAPLLTAIVAGYGVRLMELNLAGEAVLAAAVTGLAYLGVSWLVGPKWMKKRVLSQKDRVLARVRGRSVVKNRETPVA